MFPDKIRTTIGHDIRIHCNSNGNTKWFHNRVKLPQNAVISGGNNNTLILKSLTLTNKGKYLCYGSGGTGYRNFLVSAIVTVFGEFTIESSKQYRYTSLICLCVISCLSSALVHTDEKLCYTKSI